MQLGELLRNAGVIDSQQLEHALEEQAKRHNRLGEVLIDLGYVTETALTYALGEQLGIKVIPGSRLVPDASLVKLFPPALLHERLFLPLGMKGERLEVAAFDPLDEVIETAVRFFTNTEPRLLISTRSGLRKALEAVKALEQSRLRPSPQMTDVTGWLRLCGKNLPQMVEEIILNAAARRASSIHFDTEGNSLRVRFRIGRRLVETDQWPAVLAEPLAHLLQMPPGWPLPPRPANCRTAMILTTTGPKITLSIGQNTPSGCLRDLGLDEVTASKLERTLSLTHGLVLITGPSKGGRKDALLACGARLSAVGRDIILVSRDPLPGTDGMAQVPASPSADLVSSMIGLDPDAVLLDGIGDSHTLVQAARLALSGHLVLASMPADDLASLWRHIGLLGTDGTDVLTATKAVLLCTEVDENSSRMHLLLTF